MSTETGIGSAAERLVVAAAMGPTIHDTHAWRSRTRPGAIDVFADPARFRAMDDPNGRGLHLGCGAALVNLRLAALQLGREPVVRLLPDPDRPMLLATVRLCGPHRPAPYERLLYAATMRPGGVTRPRAGRPPATPLVNEFAEAARLEGAALRRLPAEATGSSSPAATGALLSTRGDSPAEWLRAGAALQRIMLHGAVRAVSASFLYEVIDPATVSAALEHGDVPQVVLRFSGAGTSTASRSKPSRRSPGSGQHSVRPSVVRPGMVRPAGA